MRYTATSHSGRVNSTHAFRGYLVLDIFNIVTGQSKGDQFGTEDESIKIGERKKERSIWRGKLLITANVPIRPCLLLTPGLMSNRHNSPTSFPILSPSIVLHVTPNNRLSGCASLNAFFDAMVEGPTRNAIFTCNFGDIRFFLEFGGFAVLYHARFDSVGSFRQVGWKISNRNGRCFEQIGNYGRGGGAKKGTDTVWCWSPVRYIFLTARPAPTWWGRQQPTWLQPTYPKPWYYTCWHMAPHTA